MLLTCLALSSLLAVPPAAKFVPCYAIKYAGPSGWPSVADAARFDLLVCSAGSDPFARTAEGTMWQRLKAANPDQRIVHYELGPGEYNTADWGRLGEGWEWVKLHHGAGTADRWIALGAQYGEPLEAQPYANERLMLVGNPQWQQFWLEQTAAKHWSGGQGQGVDGLFSDNSGYGLIWAGRWLREGHRDQADVPADYYLDGQLQPERWRHGMADCLRHAARWYREQGKTLILNFGDILGHIADWQALDAEPVPVFAAMDEGSFVHPWGRPDRFNYRTEEQWLTQVRTFRGLRQIHALLNVHGNVQSDAPGLQRMDGRDAAGRRAWDVLWYALTSFLQGFDDQRRNGYLNFTVWGYSHFEALPEFDPAVLHLGRAVGEMERVAGAAGHAWQREFSDGWVVTNPTSAPAVALPVPRGRARVITHDSLADPAAQPLVERYDLPAGEGLVLLREGRQLGHTDNR
ncbi:MAG: hypothetical protein IT204_17605 [Fimbriimonadaceae bacterium]|nr:hypothetical protein [Fimbriimonadaceae bacterium]